MSSTAFNIQYDTTPTTTSSCCGIPILALPLLEGGEEGVQNTFLKSEQQGPMDDARLAKELNELSFEEREEVYDDIHAVAKVPAETPEILEQGLKEMDQALGRLVSKRRKNLNRAMFLCPKLETDKKFKLMFLRADLYDPVLAANRMVEYYDMKAELFGEEKLADRITIQDLSEDDLFLFKCGFFIVFPTKDPVGRPVIFADHSKVDFSLFQPINVMRCFWYLTMRASYDDETAQKMGLGGVLYNSGDVQLDKIPLSSAAETSAKIGSVMSVLPARFSCLRICSVKKRPGLDFFIKSFRLAIGKFSRLRLTTHMGSDLELKYILLSFGIQCGEIFENSRQGITKEHDAFVQKRLQMDIQKDIDVAAEEAESGLVFSPKSNDVLIGRGAPYKFFPGNQRWDKLIHLNVKRYTESSNFDKTCISLEMVDAIKGCGGRFLQRTRQGWKVLDGDACREKAVRAFRTRIKSG